MREPTTIVLHNCEGKPLYILVEHIGTRRASVAGVDNELGKTVLEVDGIRHEVLESESEIEALIKAL